MGLPLTGWLSMICRSNKSSSPETCISPTLPKHVRGVLSWISISAFQTCRGCDVLSPRVCRQLDGTKELLLQDLSDPPTIAKLARAVGMNECKLKICFKKRFGTTIYALFQEERMKKAKRLLQDYNVTETAMVLGYSNVSHFSTAFLKQFGCLPSRVRQFAGVAQ